MQDDKSDQRWILRGALSGSLILHVIVAALLIFGLPQWPHEPPKEQAVNVDLVPPKPPEKPKAEPPPKPAPQPQPAAPKPAPETPKPETTESPPPAGNDAARKETMPVLNPVVQYGEKDGGPKKSLDGKDSEEGSKSAEKAEPDKQMAEQPEPEKQPVEQDEPDKQEASVPQTLTAPGGKAEAAPAKTPEAQKPKSQKAAKTAKPPKLDEAKTLFSRSATGDRLATTAMAGIPRGVRGGTLCASELRAQLEHASPPYFPNLLPSYRLARGNVIEVQKGAFRVGGQWLNLAFQCEVDAAATKVVSFAFRVGGPIPPSEWEERRLPTQ